MERKTSVMETIYKQLTPENRYRIDRRIDALLLEQEREQLAKEAVKLFNSLEWEEQQAYLYRLEQRAERQVLEGLAFETLMMLDEETRYKIMQPYIEKYESRRAQG